jgi:hypothetical protein
MGTRTEVPGRMAFPLTVIFFTLLDSGTGAMTCPP